MCNSLFGELNIHFRIYFQTNFRAIKGIDMHFQHFPENLQDHNSLPHNIRFSEKLNNNIQTLYVCNCLIFTRQNNECEQIVILLNLLKSYKYIYTTVIMSTRGKTRNCHNTKHKLNRYSQINARHAINDRLFCVKILDFNWTYFIIIVINYNRY